MSGEMKPIMLLLTVSFRSWSRRYNPYTQIVIHTNTWRINDVMKHRIGRTGTKYRSWVLVKCVWCGAYYWFWLRKETGYGFHAFLTCILLLLLLIQCKISLYLGLVQTVRPVWCFVTPVINTIEEVFSYSSVLKLVGVWEGKNSLTLKITKIIEVNHIKSHSYSYHTQYNTCECSLIP